MPRWLAYSVVRPPKCSSTAASAPLRVQIAAGPDPADGTEFLLLEVAVANTGIDPILNTRIELRVPFEVLGTVTGDIEGAGACAPTTCARPQPRSRARSRARP